MKDTPGRRRTALGVVCAVLLLGCGPAAGQTQDVVATPSPVRAVGLPSAGVTDLQVPEGGVLHDLAATDGRIVGVGAAAGRAAVWSLDADGMWNQQQVPAAADVPRLDAVALTDAAAVAFGGDGLRPSRLWVADDGTTWRAVESDAAGIDGRVTGVTVDGDRVIAVGDRVDAESGESYQGVVWASDDGRSFTAVAADLALAEGTISDVAAGSDAVVVVGFDTSGGKVWTATGGGSFEAATGPFEASTVEGVAATDDGFAAIGRGLADFELRTWTSDDGRRWRRADVEAGDIRPEDEVHGVTTVDGTVVAVGGTADGPAVWALDDGRAWRRHR